MQYNGNYDCIDYEVTVEAIDEIAEYSIKFYASEQKEFIKFINDNPDFISKKINKEHWIYKILKDNTYEIKYNKNPLLVPLGQYYYGNSYKEIVNTIPGITITQSHSLDEFVEKEKVIQAAKVCEPKRRKIYI